MDCPRYNRPLPPANFQNIRLEIFQASGRARRSGQHIARRRELPRTRRRFRREWAGDSLCRTPHLVPNYFAEAHGYNAEPIGLTMIPYGLVQFVMSFAAPKLMRWTSVRAIIILGSVVMAAGFLMNIHLDSNAVANVIVPSLVARGIGQSFIVVALGLMAVDGLEKSELRSASGLFSTVRNVGDAIGIAVASQFVVGRKKLHASRIGEGSSLTPSRSESGQ